jgi:chitinase
MKRLLLIISLLPAPALAAEPKVVGYFPEWSKYQAKDVPADKLTHLNYAFAKIVNGECAINDRFAATDKMYPEDKKEPGTFRGAFNQLSQLKKKHPHLKTLISIGGWTLSGLFSDVAFTAESREKFAKSCVAFIRKYGFDGVDIDWEFPVVGGLGSNKRRPDDKQNFTLLLAALRSRLDEAGMADNKQYFLTIAAPSGPRNIASLELDKIHKHLDWINLMAYDFHGSWDATTNFNAPLYPVKDDPANDAASRKLNVDGAITAYLDGGVPAEKLVLGVPFYGRGWDGVKNVNNGLFQTKHNIRGEGNFDYRNLAANYIGQFKRHWHDEAKVPWLFDEKKGIMISYDDPESLKLKAAYAKDKKLGGVMCWELSQDDAKGSLVSALREGLGMN